MCLDCNFDQARGFFLSNSTHARFSKTESNSIQNTQEESQTHEHNTD